MWVVCLGTSQQQESLAAVGKDQSALQADLWSFPGWAAVERGASPPAGAGGVSAPEMVPQQW